MYNIVACLMTLLSLTPALHVPNMGITHEESQPISSVKIPYLFVLYDTGETEFLKPVIDRLEMKGDDYRILVMGTSKTLVDKMEFNKEKVFDIQSFNIHENVDKNWQREKPLDSNEIKAICKFFDAQVVIAGFASKIQEQILTQYNKTPSKLVKTITVWDNFVPASKTGQADMNNTALKVVKVASSVLYPSGYVSSHMQNVNPNFQIVGQPSIESWKKDVENIDKQAVLTKLGLTGEESIISYMSGWTGSEDCRKGFDLFAKCLSEAKLDNHLFIIQPHPKTGDGAYERGILNSLGVKNYIIPKDKTVTTQEVVAITNGPFICHKTTAGVKISACGKSVIHLIPKEDIYTNALIDAKVCPKATNTAQFVDAIQSFYDPTSSESKRNLYEVMMMPENATDQVMDFITQQRVSLETHDLDQLQETAS